MDYRNAAIEAIKECLANELSPVLLAQAYAELHAECVRQLEVCMNSMFDEASKEH